MKKVLFVTEYLNPPFDEGIKKTVFNIYNELDKRYDLRVICRFGFEKNNVLVVNTNKLYISGKVKSYIADFGPEVLIYLPFQSSTFASYLRLKILNSYFKSKETIFIALQPKPIKAWEEKIVKAIQPFCGLTPSPSLKMFWDSLGINNKMIPLLTDTTIFKPLIDEKLKKVLRKKYDLPMDSVIISHMGHLNEGRNLKSLIQLQKDGFQIVIVGSSSTPQDAVGHMSLKEELLKAGIIIIDQYIERIQEIYQLSDIYIFPVIEENSSIGMPLSILEARACSIPVISTKYGSVESYLGVDSGGLFYALPDEFVETARKIKPKLPINITSSSVDNLNNQFFQILIDQIES